MVSAFVAGVFPGTAVTLDFTLRRVLTIVIPKFKKIPLLSGAYSVELIN